MGAQLLGGWQSDSAVAQGRGGNSAAGWRLMRRKRRRGSGQEGGELPSTGEGSAGGSGGQRSRRRFGRGEVRENEDQDVWFGRKKNGDFFAKG
jgi:hypothetical protein